MEISSRIFFLLEIFINLFFLKIILFIFVWNEGSGMEVLFYVYYVIGKNFSCNDIILLYRLKRIYNNFVL